jgi:CheY-like chemotaxis protein
VEPLNILLVDSHADTLLSLTLILRKRGHLVHGSATVADALVCVAAEKFHFLASELHLTDGTGWDLIEKCRPHGDIYAVALTSHASSAEKEKTLSAGFRDYILKPAVLESLEAAIAHAARERSEL